MKNGVEIEAYVTNLGKYTEGDIVGEWVKFPVSKEEMRTVLDKIGIGEKYEEIFITNYNINIDGLHKQLGEYEKLDKLNYLAGVITELSKIEQDKYEAILSSGQDLAQDGIDGLINLAYNLDKYDVISHITNEYDLGMYYTELQFGDFGYLTSNIGDLIHYIDFERYGSDCSINDGGVFCDKGYVIDTGSKWNKYYDGSLENIPDKYKLDFTKALKKQTIKKENIKESTVEKLHKYKKQIAKTDIKEPKSHEISDRNIII